MKTFTNFKNTIKDELSTVLENAELSFTTITKSTGAYEGLSIKTDDTGVCPVLNLSSAYDAYIEGKSITSIVASFLKLLTDIKKPDIDKKSFLNFNSVKNKVYPRIINTASNSSYLADKPHIEIEDLSIYFAVRVDESSEGIAEAIIDESLRTVWNVSIEEIENIAMQNLEATEPLFANIEDVLFGSGNNTIDTARVDCTIPLYLLTNPQKSRGATMALNYKALERIVSRFGDIYILPSSIDEVLIIPVSFAEQNGKSIEELSEMVRSINTSEVSEENQLSNHIYRFDRINRKLVFAE